MGGVHTGHCFFRPSMECMRVPLVYGGVLNTSSSRSSIDTYFCVLNSQLQLHDMRCLCYHTSIGFGMGIAFDSATSLM